ncbi:ankyrin repeat-containing domain protein [Rhodocollybia butyracea]|uniref:Ankyrin repeat-containing domain protein n=1 Tax=Rhodocollybia butyracea TaxID=206335 RepID=A0A9P5Q8H5_9AGAR|nr:ankyrin repeat-containing domain protein [Rhodocollybia butyracea]
MGFDTSDSFRDAASYLSNAPSLAKVSNAVKLELYGLFKWLTVAHKPNTARPSIFDMTGRAKWDAWDNISKRYNNGADAENRYLEIARDLGWQQGVPGNSESQTMPEDDSAWDSESSSNQSKSREKGSGVGMGVSVSSMAAPETDFDNTMHGLAIAGDPNKLETLISLDSDVDLNAFDEFGYTPLHLACDRGNTEIVRLLLAKGADSSIKDSDEMTPLELAQTSGHEDIAQLLSNR